MYGRRLLFAARYSHCGVKEVGVRIEMNGESDIEMRVVMAEMPYPT